ncbi:MAG: AEC family transporter [Xanthomonadaceae bacterium]|nr:AEC family transporter [Xanthomonadaceae bacterium]
MARSGFLSTQALHDVNRLTYWVGLPCALFYRTAGASPDIAGVGGLLLVGAGATLLAIVAAWLVAWLLGMPTRSHGTFIQGVFRGNLAFIGLPVVFYAFAGTNSSAEDSALLVFGPMVVLYNFLSVLVLLVAGGTMRRGLLRSVSYGLLTNPILISCLAGLLVSLSGWSLPSLFQRTLTAVGQMALPLALICIGGTLHATRLRGSLRFALIGSLMKVVLVPAIGWLLAWWVGLSAEHARIMLLLLACPTASVSYVLVRQLHGDEALASSIIVLSNLFAVPAMAVVLAITA